MYCILLVEDDPRHRVGRLRASAQWELDARCVQNSPSAEEFTAFDPQLVLLDISLPFFNGYHWCTQIRAVSRVPVVFLFRVGEYEHRHGHEHGARMISSPSPSIWTC